jgi:hypothetical protein
MEWLQTIFNRFTEAFKWFYILQPWEQSLRIRLGNKIVKHEGGLHFKVPYIDFIFKQNTRLRLSVVPSQSVTTLDDKTITLSGALSYRVRDVEPLYMALHMAEQTLARQTQGIISKYIAWHEYVDCSPKQVMEHVDSELNMEKYGLEEVKFILKDFAVVKTYRFITGDVDSYNEYALQTDEAE